MHDDELATIERCARVAETMAVGPWGDPHDAIASGSLAKMIARAIRDLKLALPAHQELTPCPFQAGQQTGPSVDGYWPCSCGAEHSEKPTDPAHQERTEPLHSRHPYDVEGSEYLPETCSHPANRAVICRECALVAIRRLIQAAPARAAHPHEDAAEKFKRAYELGYNYEALVEVELKNSYGLTTRFKWGSTLKRFGMRVAARVVAQKGAPARAAEWQPLRELIQELRDEISRITKIYIAEYPKQMGTLPVLTVTMWLDKLEKLVAPAPSRASRRRNGPLFERNARARNSAKAQADTGRFSGQGIAEKC